MKREISQASERRSKFTQLFVTAVSTDIASFSRFDEKISGVDKLIEWIDDLNLNIVSELRKFNYFDEASALEVCKIRRLSDQHDIVSHTNDVDEWRSALLTKRILENNFLMQHSADAITDCIFKILADGNINAPRLSALSVKRGELDMQKMAKLRDIKVFIVHGHDSDNKFNELSNFLFRVGLGNHIRLADQAGVGRTIIDKFESEASDSDLAIILLTGDDKGYAVKDGPDAASFRARQNVWFEAGYFYAKLGRNRTFLLKSEEVEFPSDVSGVIYINMTEKWELKLVKELKNENIDVNADNLI